MNGDNAQVTVGVHVHPETSMAVTAFHRFVTIAVGELPGMATLFLHSEDELDRLAAAGGEGEVRRRADLVHERGATGGAGFRLLEPVRQRCSVGRPRRCRTFQPIPWKGPVGMSKPRSNNPDAVQASMFVYRVDQVARRLALSDGTPRWQYPCGLCNGQLVTEPGALCGVCAPVAPRSRRKTAKPRTTKTRKGAT